MKKTLQEKAKRNKRIVDYFQKHPHTSCAKVARIFKITRMRVWQIKKAGEHHD